MGFDHWYDYLIMLVPLFVVWMGIDMIITPAEKQVNVNSRRNGGSWLYRNAPDHDSGVRRASIFYKLMGLFLIAFGGFIIVGFLHDLIWKPS